MVSQGPSIFLSFASLPPLDLLLRFARA